MIDYFDQDMRYLEGVAPHALNIGKASDAAVRQGLPFANAARRHAFALSTKIGSRQAMARRAILRATGEKRESMLVRFEAWQRAFADTF